MKITPFFRWFDLWIGAYVDTKNRALYVCPVPMLGVKVELAPKWEAYAEGSHVYHRSRMSHRDHRYGVIVRRDGNDPGVVYTVRWLDFEAVPGQCQDESCWHEELMLTAGE